MKTNHLFASAAVAAVLLITAPARAQVLGGAVRGGAGGAFAGSFGSFGGMGSTNGRMSAGTDTSLRGNTRVHRTADEGAREASKISARASDTTTAAVHAGRDRSEAVAQGAIMSGAAETHNTRALAASGAAETATTATRAGENGNAEADAGREVQPASRIGKPAESARTRTRSGSSNTQSAGDTRDTSGSHSAEPPHRVAPEADGSAAASADASVNVSTAQ